MSRGKRSVLLSLMLAVMSLAACGSRNDKVQTAVDGAEDIFAASKIVNIDADIDSVSNKADVLADGQPVGQVRESGITDPRITYSVNGEDRFSIAFYTKGDIGDERYPSAATYAYYDMNGNILGYAQERLLFKGDDIGFVMTFLSADGTMKDYFIEANDTSTHNWADKNASVRSMDRKQAGTVELSLVSSRTGECAVKMSLGEAAGELSEMDRTAIYWHCTGDLYARYSRTD